MQTREATLSDLKSAAGEAWTFSLPLIEIAVLRKRVMALGHTPNGLRHMRNLSNHRARAVTTPNNDTLYSSAHLDLSHGPVTLTLPATGDRYVSVALMDAYTNNFAVLGTRTTGGAGGVFRLVGPTDAADGPDTIRSPTPHVWCLARILVDGAADLEAARAVQQGFSITGPEATMFVVDADRHSDWRAYFSAAAELMAADPPAVTDQKLIRRIEAFGFGRGFDATRYSAAEIADIEAGVSEARARAASAGMGGGFIEGWSYPYAQLGDFDQDYDYRAAVAVAGLAALPVVEAMYMLAEGESGGCYDGAASWRLHFAADRMLPVNSFWSLSLYEATNDGQFFFTDNALDRYAIGDRTETLTFNPDGSLDIWIGHQDPGADRLGNWLPAPNGPFALFMRAYLPKPELLHGAYRLPPVEKLS